MKSLVRPYGLVQLRGKSCVFGVWFWGLGFRVQGLGFGVSVVRPYGLVQLRGKSCVYEVLGFGFWGFGFRV